MGVSLSITHIFQTGHQLQKADSAICCPHLRGFVIPLAK